MGEGGGYSVVIGHNMITSKIGFPTICVPLFDTIIL